MLRGLPGREINVSQSAPLNPLQLQVLAHFQARIFHAGQSEVVVFFLVWKLINGVITPINDLING